MPNRVFRVLAVGAVLGCGIALTAGSAQAANCIISHTQLTKALKASVKPAGGPSNGGFDNNEWAAVIARDGSVCAVTFSGNTVGSQWPASRAIAVEKANTANGLSLQHFAMATANLWAGVQPGGYLYGAAATNPPNPALLYKGPAAKWGSADDPLVGKTPGGAVAFGGGLALYGKSGLIGALGVSGDTSCADHNVAWRVRHLLGFDHVPNGVSPNHKDQIIYDVGPDGKSASGFGHPTCGGKEAQVAQEIGAGVIGKGVNANDNPSKLPNPGNAAGNHENPSK
jgi:hypothetical protein